MKVVVFVRQNARLTRVPTRCLSFVTCGGRIDEIRIDYARHRLLIVLPLLSMSGLLAV